MLVYCCRRVATQVLVMLNYYREHAFSCHNSLKPPTTSSPHILRTFSIFHSLLHSPLQKSSPFAVVRTLATPQPSSALALWPCTTVELNCSHLRYMFRLLWIPRVRVSMLVMQLGQHRDGVPMLWRGHYRAPPCWQVPSCRTSFSLSSITCSATTCLDSA